MADFIEASLDSVLSIGSSARTSRREDRKWLGNTPSHSHVTSSSARAQNHPTNAADVYARTPMRPLPGHRAFLSGVGGGVSSEADDLVSPRLPSIATGRDELRAAWASFNQQSKRKGQGDADEDMSITGVPPSVPGRSRRLSGNTEPLQKSNHRQTQHMGNMGNEMRAAEGDATMDALVPVPPSRRVQPHIVRLPRDLLTVIASFLDVRALCHFGATHRLAHRITSQHSLWLLHASALRLPVPSSGFGRQPPLAPVPEALKKAVIEHTLALQRALIQDLTAAEAELNDVTQRVMRRQRVLAEAAASPPRNATTTAATGGPISAPTSSSRHSTFHPARRGLPLQEDAAASNDPAVTDFSTLQQAVMRLQAEVLQLRRDSQLHVQQQEQQPQQSARASSSSGAHRPPRGARSEATLQINASSSRQVNQAPSLVSIFDSFEARVVPLVLLPFRDVAEVPVAIRRGTRTFASLELLFLSPLFAPPTTSRAGSSSTSRLVSPQDAVRRRWSLVQRVLPLEPFFDAREASIGGTTGTSRAGAAAEEDLSTTRSGHDRLVAYIRRLLAMDDTSLAGVLFGGAPV